jgi:hypothetical protein
VIKVLDSIALHNNNACFFRVRGIDKHFGAHNLPFPACLLSG